MSKLQAFLNPVATEVTEEVVISNRFLDEEKKPVPFVVKGITQEENNALIKRATTREKRNGQLVENLDRPKYQALLIQACVVEPDFCQKELCDKYGVVDPLMVPARMLLSGEYANLVNAIMETNGFQDPENVEEEAKN